MTPKCLWAECLKILISKFRLSEDTVSKSRLLEDTSQTKLLEKPWAGGTLFSGVKEQSVLSPNLLWSFLDQKA
jgi:hypothetical protein